ncbi:MAG: hypothetical protein AAGF57_00655 [Pseudomonadota bacterium]
MALPKEKAGHICTTDERRTSEPSAPAPVELMDYPTFIPRIGRTLDSTYLAARLDKQALLNQSQARYPPQNCDIQLVLFNIR